jgi:Leucine-rich repeat (LRR) protein
MVSSQKRRPPAISAAIRKQIERLGGIIQAEAEIPAEVDTHIGRQPIAPALAWFAYGVRWPDRARYFSREEPRATGIHFTRATFVDKGDHFGGVGVIEIGSDEQQYLYFAPVNGGRTKSDPDIYRVDHEGPYELEGEGQRLSEFLKALISETEPTAQPNVGFKDPKLARAIYMSQGSGKKLDRSALARIETLSIDVSDVKSFEGIEQCTTLRVLGLSGYRVKGIVPVAKLARLEELDLPYDFRDLRFVRSLTRLRRLRALAAGDLRSLKGLTQLEELSVGEVSSLAPLAILPSLRKLVLKSCYDQDLKPLAGLLHLTNLDIRLVEATEPVVTDLDPLASIAQLEELSLAAEAVKSLEPLTKLSKLRRVTLDCKIAPPPLPLAQSESLTELTIAYTGNRASEGLRTLADIRFVEAMGSLERVNFRGNQIADLSPLVKLLCLKNAVLHNNPIDLDAPMNRNAIATMRRRGVVIELT